MKKAARWIWKHRKGNHFSDKHRYALAIHKLERSWPFQFLAIGAAIIGLGVLIWTLISIRDDLDFRQQERENWRLDRIERAWNRVLRKVGGNTGKGEAINYLLAQKIDLNGIDFSCPTDLNFQANRECSTATIVNGVKFKSFQKDKNQATQEMNFSYMNLRNWEIKNEGFSGKFNDTIITNSIFLNARVAMNNSSRTFFLFNTFRDTTVYLGKDVRMNNNVFDNVYFTFPNASQIEKSEFTNSIVPAKRPPRCKQDGTNFEFQVCGFVKTAKTLLCDNARTKSQLDFVELNFQSHKKVGRVFPHRPNNPEKGDIGKSDIFERNFLCASEFKDVNYSLPISYDEAKRRYPEIYK